MSERMRVKRMPVADRLSAHRAKSSSQEEAATSLLRLVATANQVIELDGAENLVARALLLGAITQGRAAGIRDAIRGRRRKLSRAKGGA